MTLTPSVNICVLCKSPIGAQTKPEHVLLNALGGRMTVSHIICPACNQAMGNGPDKDLADSVAFIRNMCGMSAGDGDDAPTIRGLQTDGERFDLMPGMEVKMRPYRPLEVRVTEDRVDVDIGAYSDAQADTLAENAARSIAKKLGKSSEAVVQAIKQDILKDRKVQIVPAPAISQQLKFGTGRSQQAMAKACLVLWSKAVGTEEVLNARYDFVRSFILSSDSDFSGVKLDTRSWPGPPEKYGTNPNYICVGSNGDGAVFGYYRLFGAIGWRFNLCESGAPPNSFCCLISNPLHIATWDFVIGDQAFDLVRPMFEEWDPWPPNFAEVQAALSRLAELAHQRSQDKTALAWVTEAVSRTGLVEGEEIKEEHVRSVVKYITPRILATVLRKSIPTDE